MGRAGLLWEERRDGTRRMPVFKQHAVSSNGGNWSGKPVIPVSTRRSSRRRAAGRSLANVAAAHATGAWADHPTQEHGRTHMLWL